MKQHFKLALYLAAVIAFSGAKAGSYDDFFRAVNVDDAGAVVELLARGFDPNAPDDKGQVGLFLALRDDSPKVLAALLSHPGVKIDATNSADESPLMMAALRGRLDWTRQLLERGARVNRPGWTPLHYAASGPEPKVVLLLLERGADIEALSPNGTTPLMMAARYGAQDAADLLLARGASAGARNAAGLNATDFARHAGRADLAASLERAVR
jgi:ankyrin repeat protein